MTKPQAQQLADKENLIQQKKVCPFFVEFNCQGNCVAYVPAMVRIATPSEPDIVDNWGITFPECKRLK